MLLTVKMLMSGDNLMYNKQIIAIFEIDIPEHYI